MISHNSATIRHIHPSNVVILVFLHFVQQQKWQHAGMSLRSTNLYSESGHKGFIHLTTKIHYEKKHLIKENS